MNKTLLAIAGVCIVIAVLSPIAVYTHFNSIVESYQLQIESYQLQLKANEDFTEKIRDQIQKPYDPSLMEPYLVTKLGWYLHDSLDPVPASRNELTIYGAVTNTGSETAFHCKLIVYFYVNNTVVQTSEISIGTIYYWSSSYVNRY